jgi:phytoene dehydrogenase-like protein
LRRYCAKRAGQSDETRTTLEFLHDFGFSDSFIHTFFQPFYAGIFLENQLNTSAAVFIYTFDRFSRGLASIPSKGMGAIPAQLAEQLTQCDLRLNTEVVKLTDNQIHTAGQASFSAGAIILATPFHITDALLGQQSDRKWKQTQCLYFAAPTPPIKEPVLVLNSNQNDPINLVCVPSNVAPSLAPKGQSLICVSLNEGHEAVSVHDILNALRMWFGADVAQWRHLKTYHIPYALPSAMPGEIMLKSMSHMVNGYYVCGDHCTIPTIDHALGSGLAAASALLQDMHA